MQIYPEEQAAYLDALMPAFRDVVTPVLGYVWMEERPCLELEDVVEHDRLGADIVAEALCYNRQQGALNSLSPIT